METSIRIIDYHLKERIEGQNSKITLSVNYHQFIVGSNNVLFLNIANITLISLWAVASTAFL
jgi:hypothetical protein